MAVSPDSGSAALTCAVAAPHALAAEAALHAYRDGGNAIDAAITAAAVLTVVYPHNVALGSDLIALVRTPDGTVRCVNASGWAAAQVNADELRATHGRTMPVLGADTVTVPGSVRGWDSLRRFGARLSWERTLQPAQAAAQHGVPVARSLATHIADAAANSGTADFDRVFCPGGRPRRAGEDFAQPELAASLARLRASGPADFYEGELASRMVDYLQRRGSRLETDDFAAFSPEIVAPLTLEFRGLTVMTSPPNTPGFLLLRVLAAIGELEIAGPLGGGFATLMSIFNAGNALRARALADPRYAHVDLDTESLFPTGGPAQAAHGDTVGIATADSAGYAVSLIQSVFHSFGSGLIDPATGILFQNRGAGFSLNEESPNVIAPRKRPAHTLMPVLTTQAGTPRHVLATMGGQGQPQIMAQVLLRAVGGETAEGAIAAARAIVGPQLDGHSLETVFVEADLDAVARRALVDSGMAMVEVAPHTEDLGQANAVFIGQHGSMTAASDPRSDGAAFVAHYPRYRTTPST